MTPHWLRLAVVTTFLCAAAGALAQEPPARRRTRSPAAAASVEREAATATPGRRPVQVVRFTGLDIEGRVRSPELLHFRRRIREGLDTRRLPPRSFVPELLRTARHEAIR